ncbi:MAG: hypothetical protein KDA96_06330 [Planctomycetaceae bacterium]|nr:hypothetical protein [Planctomycetaceae bacterium]
MPKRLRLKKIVNWKVQGPFIWRLVLHFFAYNAAVLGLLLAAWGIQTAVAAVTDSPVVPHVPTLWERIAPLAIAMAVMTPFMIWDLMRITNRVAGPLYRFECLLNEFVESGRISHARLREGDLPTDFQKKFNEFVEAMHGLYPETVPEKQPAAKSESRPAGDAAGDVQAAEQVLETVA